MKQIKPYLSEMLLTLRTLIEQIGVRVVPRAFEAHRWAIFEVDRHVSPLDLIRVVDAWRQAVDAPLYTLVLYG